MQAGHQAKQVARGGVLFATRGAGGLTRQRIAVRFSRDRPLQQELGLQLQSAAAIAEADLRCLVADEEAVAVLAVLAQHQSVIHLFFLSDPRLPRYWDRQPFIKDQAVAAGLDHGVAVGLQRGNHIFRVQPGLGWREGVIGKCGPIGPQAAGGEGHPLGLQPPAADAALHQLVIAHGGEGLKLLGSRLAELIHRVRRGELAGEAKTALRLEAALEGHVADPLGDGLDDPLALQLLALCPLPGIAASGGRGLRRRHWRCGLAGGGGTGLAGGAGLAGRTGFAGGNGFAGGTG